jgi:DNA mismatch endonuclease (patch repair protein)
MMSRVGPKGTNPELIFSSFLRRNKIKFRQHLKSLPGSPDFVLKDFDTVVFVHGCFWHGHKNCKYYKLPSTNISFWKAKIEANRLRDATKTRMLRKLGWRVIVVWQCQLKKQSYLEKMATRISAANKG